jgi:ribosomal protein L16 Arg81 hydroxylase
MSSPFSLEQLLAPVAPRVFLEEYWEQRPLVLKRGEPGYYASLLSAADVDAQVTGSDLTYPEFRLVRSGTPLPLGDYTRTTSSTGAPRRVADADRIVAEYQAGATVILQGLHRRWPALAALCRSLEERLSHPTQTNVYVTPPGSQGFAPHYDTHDVFILQVDGAKHWRLYDAPFPLPVNGQPFSATGSQTGELTHELDLEAGDLIYLPRGFVHEALTSTERSIHVTLGITTYTWLDLLQEAAAQCGEDLRFRRALPAGFADSPEVRRMMAAELRDLASALAEPEIAGRAVERIVDRLVNTRRPVGGGQLFVSDAARFLDGSTVLRRRPGVIFRMREDGEAATLSFHGKQVALPAFAAEALRFCTREEPFRAAELPDTLDDAGKLVLARRLLLEGFLEHA